MSELFYALLLLIAPPVEASLIGIVDGDTLDASTGRIRLLGINAPERGERCYASSKAKLTNLVGKSFDLERDLVNRDKYGRLLRHVRSGSHVNLKMVDSGEAKSYCIFPNVHYCDLLAETQVNAMNQGKGCMWSPSNQSCLSLGEVNRQGDWVEVKNSCDETHSAWIESDGRQKENVFLCGGCSQKFTLEVGRFVVLTDSWGLIDWSS